MLDLLGQCEQKLLKLMDDLGGKDIEDILKEDAEVKHDVLMFVVYVYYSLFQMILPAFKNHSYFLVLLQ